MSPDRTGELGSILGIWGHPDDEAWLTAGLMMRAVGAGRRVMCVTATRGEAGFPAEDPRSVAERMAIRESELAACLAILGVTEHRYLGYGDGECGQVPDEEAADTLAEIITEVQPDTVVTFEPYGITGHVDHIAVCRWTTKAVGLAALPGTRLMYATKTRAWRDEFFAGVDPSTVMMVEGLEPEVLDESELGVWFTCDDALVPRKVAAMLAQASQIEALASDMGVEAFTALLRDEFLRDAHPSDAALIERASTIGRA
jgi:LmbE family N-acetylglucosaminyl deacetylase